MTMTLRVYLAQQILSLAGLTGTRWDRFLHLSVVVFGPLLGILDAHLHGLISSSVFFWITAFWAMDWILGSMVAWRKHEWSPRRGLYSVSKWITWITVLAIAWGLRDSQAVGGSLIAGCLETAVLLTEGASVLRNLCLLWPSDSIVGRILKRLANRMERETDDGCDCRHKSNGRPILATTKQDNGA